MMTLLKLIKNEREIESDSRKLPKSRNHLIDIIFSDEESEPVDLNTEVMHQHYITINKVYVKDFDTTKYLHDEINSITAEQVNEPHINEDDIYSLIYNQIKKMNIEIASLRNKISKGLHNVKYMEQKADGKFS